MEDENPLDTVTPRNLLNSLLLRQDPVQTIRRIHEDAGINRSGSDTTRHRPASAHAPPPKVHEAKSGELHQVKLCDDESTPLPRRKFKVKRIRLEDLDLANVAEAPGLENFTDELLSKLRHVTHKQNTNISREQLHGKEKTSTIGDVAQVVTTSNTQNSTDISQRDVDGINVDWQPGSSTSHDGTKIVTTDIMNSDLRDYTHSSRKGSEGIKEVPSNESIVDETADNMKKERVSLETVVTASDTDLNASVGLLELSLDAGDDTQKDQQEPLNERPSTENFSTKVVKGHAAGGHHSLNSGSEAVPKRKQSLSDHSFGREIAPQVVVQSDGKDRDRGPSTSVKSGDPSTLSAKRSRRLSKAVLSKRKTVSQRPYALPFPKSQLLGIVQHYSSLKLSREACSEIGNVSESYFARTSMRLERLCRKGKRKIINASDVQSMMMRRGYITSRQDLNALVEEILPYEYRNELIPVASAGNAVYP